MHHRAPQQQTSARRSPCAGDVAGHGHREVSIQRLEGALETVALLVIEDEIYLPVFERLEAELILARDAQNALERARGIARRARSQMATR